MTADRLLQLGAPRMLLGLLGTERANFDHPIYPGLVASDLNQVALVEMIGPAITHVPNQQEPAVHIYHLGSAAHALATFFVLGGIIDLLIGLFHGRDN